MRNGLQGLPWVLLGLAVGLLLFGAMPQAHALPEYATRTGEPCATCHVNPAGGGPRTARGALWIAQGRPDIVPEAPASAQPGTLASGDGAPGGGGALYKQFGCAGCHGAAGEGASGPALDVPDADGDAEQVIRKGRGTMMAFKTDRLSDPDLAAIVQFVRSLADGSAEQTAAPQRVDPAAYVCASAPDGAAMIRSCGGN